MWNVTTKLIPVHLHFLTKCVKRSWNIYNDIYAMMHICSNILVSVKSSVIFANLSENHIEGKQSSTWYLAEVLRLILELDSSFVNDHYMNMILWISFMSNVIMYHFHWNSYRTIWNFDKPSFFIIYFILKLT